MKLFIAALIALGLTVGGVAVACDKHKEGAKTAKNDAEPANISVEAAAQAAKAGKVIMVDANSEKTRKSEGVVPGARLLSSSSGFDMSELKASKGDKLVFYCYNEQCGAAPAAAKMAKQNGYEAKVMHAGIVGWKKAGNKVDTI